MGDGSGESIEEEVPVIGTSDWNLGDWREKFQIPNLNGAMKRDDPFHNGLVNVRVVWHWTQLKSGSHGADAARCQITLDTR